MRLTDAGRAMLDDARAALRHADRAARAARRAADGRAGALEIVPVWSEPVVAALPGDHALARSALLRLRDLPDEPFVPFPRNSAPRFYDQLITACQSAGFSPNIVQEALAMPALVSLVAAGLGVALVPRSLNGLAGANAAYVPLDADVRAEIAMITNADEHDGALLDRFTSNVRRTLA